MTNAEIKIGEYVRTLDGDIFKLKGYYTEENIYSMTDNRGTLYGNPRKVVKNHDFDIKKLIEKGDYVNGIEVEEFDDDEGNLYLGFGIFTDSCMDCIEEIRPLSTVDIKTIVTHEQFENMEFKVGGEDD